MHVNNNTEKKKKKKKKKKRKSSRAFDIHLGNEIGFK